MGIRRESGRGMTKAFYCMVNDRLLGIVALGEAEKQRQLSLCGPE